VPTNFWRLCVPISWQRRVLIQVIWESKDYSIAWHRTLLLNVENCEMIEQEEQITLNAENTLPEQQAKGLHVHMIPLTETSRVARWIFPCIRMECFIPLAEMKLQCNSITRNTCMQQPLAFIFQTLFQHEVFRITPTQNTGWCCSCMWCCRGNTIISRIHIRDGKLV
jgi:hypothetical protein